MESCAAFRSQQSLFEVGSVTRAWPDVVDFLHKHHPRPLVIERLTGLPLQADSPNVCAHPANVRCTGNFDYRRLDIVILGIVQALERICKTLANGVVLHLQQVSATGYHGFGSGQIRHELRVTQAMCGRQLAMQAADLNLVNGRSGNFLKEPKWRSRFKQES